MNTFNSNDYALGKEYQNRMQAKAQRIQQAYTIQPEAAERNSIAAYLPHKPVIIIITMIIATLFFASVSSAHAQSGSSGFDPGGDVQMNSHLFDMAIYYIGEKNYEQAVIELTTLLEIDPEFSAAYVARGVSHYYLGDYDAAIADYSQALFIFPGYPSAYNFRAMAYLAQGNEQQAIVDGRRAASLDTNYANAYWTLGNAYIVAEDYEAAQSSLERYIELSGEQVLPQAAGMLTMCQEKLNA